MIGTSSRKKIWIDLLHFVGRDMYHSFEINRLKALLYIELRKYQGQAKGLSLKDKYRIIKGGRQ